jgi:hypothetical protein
MALRGDGVKHRLVSRNIHLAQLRVQKALTVRADQTRIQSFVASWQFRLPTVPTTTGVSKTVAPTAVFNLPINPLTMTPANVYLVQSSNGVHAPGTLSLSADNLTITFTPTAALAANTQYYLQVYNVTDEAGNIYAGSTTYFTTGP